MTRQHLNKAREMVRRASKPALAVLLVLLAGHMVVAYLALREMRAHYQDQAASLRTHTWMFGQLQVHAGRTLVQFENWVEDSKSVSQAEFQEQFDVLWSRIHLLHSSEGMVALSEWPDRAEILQHYQDEMVALEPLVGRLEALTADEIASFRVRLRRLVVDAGDLVVEDGNRRGPLFLRLGEFAEAVMSRFERGFVALLAVGLVMASMMLASWRRLDRLLHATRAAAERAVAAERDLRTVIDALPAMVAATDAQGRYIFVNRFHAEFHGISTSDAVGSSPTELGLAPFEPAMPDDEIGRETRSLDTRGREHVLLSRIVAVRGVDGAIERQVVIGLDITERKRAEDRVRFLALHDELTSLPNRTHFCEQVEEHLATGTAAPALVLVDLDDFKEVNDSLGHGAGDELLMGVACRLREAVGEDGQVHRLGGDEFAILIDAAAPGLELETFGHRILAELSRPLLVAGQRMTPSASLGISAAPHHGDSLGDLLRHADVALYAAKRSGRGTLRLFTPDLAAGLERRRAIESALGEALAGERGLQLHYQPKIELGTGALAGFEALLRWNDAELGPLSPGEFVPIAEASGQIAMLGAWVVREACRQIAAWEPLLAGCDISVAVNLSGAELVHDETLLLLEREIVAAGIDARHLQVEITETVCMRDIDRAIALCGRLRERGFKVAIDDFGTGYSSLGYLVRLPFDTLKIDRSFILAMTEPGPGLGVANAIVELARTLGVRVVAEGVETPVQAALLQQIGAHEAQGWHYGRPMPAVAAEMLLRAPERVRLAA